MLKLINPLNHDRLRKRISSKEPLTYKIMEKITTLVSSKEFGKTLKNVNYIDYRKYRDRYDELLDLPLTLGMFIPVDDEGFVMKDPCQHNRYCADFCQGDCSQDYYESQSKVLFEGVPKALQQWYLNNSKVEDLCSIVDSLTPIRLSETALKQIYG